MASAVRPAVLSDAPLLPGIEADAARLFEELPELEWIARMPVADVHVHRMQIAAGLTWVSTDATHTPCGFITIEWHGPTLHIAELSVSRVAQCKGHGKALMQAVIDTARHARAILLTLTTFRDVPWNRPFYERLGFSVIEKGMLDRRLAAILDAEATSGFDPTTRCAMQYRFPASADLAVGS